MYRPSRRLTRIPPDRGCGRMIAPRLTFARTLFLPMAEMAIAARSGLLTRPQQLHLFRDQIKSLGPSRRPIKVRLNINQYPNRSLLDLL